MICCIILLVNTTSALAAISYSVRTYNQYGQQTGEFRANDDPGFYNVDQVLVDPTRGGYTNDNLDFKAVALISHVSAYKVRFKSYVFDPNLTSNVVGDGRTNKYYNVYYAQMALTYLGWNPMSNVDGYWGPKTKTSVRNFQIFNGLSADGVIGPRTWRLLASDGAKASGTILSLPDTPEYAISSEYGISSKDSWDEVRSILTNTSYSKTTAQEELQRNNFIVQYRYIDTDKISYNEVVGFSVNGNIVTLSIRK